MRLRDKVLSTAYHLGFKKELPQYAGTGFVVAVPGAYGNSHLYVVTAKRVAEKMERFTIIMGFSYRDGGKAQCRNVFTEGTSQGWWPINS